MSAPMTRAPLTLSAQMSHARLAVAGQMGHARLAVAGPASNATLPAPGPMTKAELLALFPGVGFETEQARGRFLSALRLRDALLLPARLIARLRAWNARRATALALMSLPEDMLRDIGLTRGEIARVADESAARPA